MAVRRIQARVACRTGSRFALALVIAGEAFLSNTEHAALGQWYPLISDPEPLNTNAAIDSEGDWNPQLATDGQGNWVAVWESWDDLGGTIDTDRDVLVARSVDNGATWSAPAALNTNATADSGPDFYAQVATDGEGQWVAVWESQDDLGGTIFVDDDILVARSTDNGVSWSAPVALKTTAGSDGSAYDVHPDLTTNTLGTWIAAWYSNDDLGGPIGTDGDILFSRSIDDGASWTAAAALNTNAASDGGADRYPELATDGQGNWTAVWFSEDDLGATIGTDRDILVSRSDDDGVSWTTPVALNSEAASDGSLADENPQVSTDRQGNWVAVWFSTCDLGGAIGTDRDILFSRSIDNGASWTAQAPLNTNAASDAGDDFDPQVTTDGQGTWVTVWSSNDNIGGMIGTDKDILFSTSTDNGVAWSAPAALNTNATTDVLPQDDYPQLTTDRQGNWAAVWQSNNDVAGPIGMDYDILVARLRLPTYVDASATGPTHDGTSWCNAYLHLQDALAAASTGTTIRVANGTYMPDGGYTPVGGAHIPGTGDRSATFQLISGVTIECGYAGCGAPDPDARDIEANETTLSGDLACDDVPVSCTQDSPDCDSYGELCIDGSCIIKQYNGENSYHVVTGSGTDATAGLNGFTITAGNVDLPYPNDRGGGLYNQTGSPTLTNCTISRNRSARLGGGVYNDISSAPTFTNCTFSGNRADMGGGGMYNYNGSGANLDNCTFINNSAVGGGGCTDNVNSSSRLTNSTFIGNSGGGMSIGNDSSPALVNCTFIGNSRLWGGGIHDNSGGNATLTNCVFTGNQGGGQGGGVYFSSTGNPMLTNCTFSGNYAEWGGGIYALNTNLTITNCVLWGNRDDSGNDEYGQILAPGGPTNVTYTLIQGLDTFSGGIGNIDEDPLFFDADGADSLFGTEDDDLRLLTGSLAIDAGDNDALPADDNDLDDDGDTAEKIPIDLAGSLRVVDDPDTPDTGIPGSPVVDMGAYEYFPDCNGNGLPDVCDLDCGALSGACDLSGCGASSDCQDDIDPGFGIPDECDIAAGTAEDCNGNGIPDSCDISTGFSLDENPADGVPDECGEFTGSCDPPTDEWTCFDNWDLPGDEYPDDIDSAGNVFVTLDTGDNVFLDEDVIIPALTIETGAMLRITQTGEEGDLDFSAPATFNIEGVVRVGDDRAIGLGGVQPPAVTVGASGVYAADPYAIEPVSADLYASTLTILPGDVFPAGPCEFGGLVRLTGSMSLTTAGDLRLEGSTDTLCMPAGVVAGGVSPPPKLKIEDSSSVMTQGSLIMAGTVESTNTSSAGVTLSGNFDNQATHPSLYDWTTGTLIMNGTSPQTFEVAGIDLGATMEGFSTDADARLDTAHHNNFAIGTLEVSSTADVTFSNQFANTIGSGACREALYVGNLTFQPGATVTIDNCKVYYVNLEPGGAAPNTLGTCAELLPVSGVAPPIRDPYEMVKNRYISLVLTPVVIAGAPAETAIRVTLTSLHHPDAPEDAPDFGAWEGRFRWVNSLNETHTCPDSPNFNTTIRCAVLGCDPEYRAWGAELNGDVLYMTGASVVPSSQYEVQQFDSSCQGNEASCTALSAELSLDTAQFGDVGPPMGSEEDPIWGEGLGVLDIARVVDHVKGGPYPMTWPPEAGTALFKPSVHLRPNVPDVLNENVGVLDIATAVDAVKGKAYWHFGDFGPCTDACPGEAPCP